MFPLYSLSLEDHVNNKGPLTKYDSLSVLKGISMGVQEVHNLGYRHNDLKPANVLISINDSGEIIPAITDFGSCGPKVVEVRMKEDIIHTHRKMEAQRHLTVRFAHRPLRFPTGKTLSP